MQKLLDPSFCQTQSTGHTTSLICPVMPKGLDEDRSCCGLVTSHPQFWTVAGQYLLLKDRTMDEHIGRLNYGVVDEKAILPCHKCRKWLWHALLRVREFSCWSILDTFHSQCKSHIGKCTAVVLGAAVPSRVLEAKAQGATYWDIMERFVVQQTHFFDVFKIRWFPL